MTAVSPQLGTAVARLSVYEYNRFNRVKSGKADFRPFGFFTVFFFFFFFFFSFRFLFSVLHFVSDLISQLIVRYEFVKKSHRGERSLSKI